ncbi:MAG: inositol monophosphatase [Gemmatimonadota bacterium]|nr:inositol monophosphatase [Gemmatimonadota bacterium]MDH3366641.1 inositol monophosphatase [Gemmatimonadota bacterium]MDH3477250.1 inositol monophosphatase [Gemmatimonadota bacterium]MDH5549980.1 inositol monophosphatase [Gemmatimonadota bacterium]
MSEYYDLLAVALPAAAAAADHIRSRARPLADAWHLKGQSDFVTQVDLETEALIADRLRQAVPGSVVLGEELTPHATSADLVWVVDPLDGTTNFLHGYPAYGVSIGAVVEDEPTVGVVVDVARSITYHAIRGGGAWCEGRQLAVSTTTEPASALIGTGFPFKVAHLLPTYLRQFSAILQRTAGVRRAGAASLDFASIAQGQLDGFWELHLAPWDVAAGTVLVREAGGMVTDLEGNAGTLRHGPYVAGNPVIHAWMLEVLRESGTGLAPPASVPTPPPKPAPA